MLIVTSAAAIGTASLDQLLAVSQSPPLGLILETEERTTRDSAFRARGATGVSCDRCSRSMLAVDSGCSHGDLRMAKATGSLFETLAGSIGKRILALCELFVGS